MSLNWYKERRGYQADITNFVIEEPRAAVFLEMGLGKTAAVLHAIQQLLYFGEIKRVLVIAPPRVATSVWPNEVELWDEFSKIRYANLMGTPRERKRIFEWGSQIQIISYALVPWLVQMYRGRSWPYDMVVIDEPRGLKKPGAAQFKALKKINRLTKRFVIMTGTPSPNGYHELWCPYFLLDEGKRLGTTHGAFMSRWFRTSETRVYAHDWTATQISNLTADITRAMKTGDHIDLPEMITNDIEVTLPPQAMRFYKDLEDEMFVRLEEHLATHGTVTAVNAAALTGKCLQVASGSVYLSDEDGRATKDWTAVHDAKLEALEDIIEGNPGQPILVAYWFKHELTRLLKRFPKARVLDKDPNTVNEWNAGEIQLLLAHPQSAGHGLNLQHGGHHLVWFSVIWSYELYAQMIKRLHRSGQDDNVFIHRLLAKGTLDRDVVRRTTSKEEIQDILFEKLQAHQDQREAA